MRLIFVAPWLALVVVLVGCSEQSGESADQGGSTTAKSSAQSQELPTAGSSAPAERGVDMAQLARGGTLFQENCAACHGTHGEGAPDWHKPGPDGKYPAPPLNGTGHAWHHPMKVLRRVIKNGTAAQGGTMPPWKDKLSDQEIGDIIAWFQAKWPDELYAAWYRRDQSSQ